MRQSDRYWAIGVKRRPAYLIKFSNSSSKILFCLAERRQISYDEHRRYTGIAGGGAEIEYPRGSRHDVYRQSCQLAQMGGRIRHPDRRLCHRGAALQKGLPRRQLGAETGHRQEQGPRHQSVSGG